MKGSFLGHLEGPRGEEDPSRDGGWRVFTRLSSSGSSLKKGLCSCSCWWTKFSMSTSKLAEVMHSEPWVACSHFSNSSVRSGKRGCLWGHQELTHAHTDTCTGGLRSHQGPCPTFPSLLLPRSHSLRMSPVPMISLDGSISCPGGEDLVSCPWGLSRLPWRLTFLFGKISCMDS